MADVTVAFDTLKAATRLQHAGFDEGKARALVSTFAEGMVENLATKQDLAPLATKEEIAKLATKGRGREARAPRRNSQPFAPRWLPRQTLRRYAPR